MKHIKVVIKRNGKSDTIKPLKGNIVPLQYSAPWHFNFTKRIYSRTNQVIRDVKYHKFNPYIDKILLQPVSSYKDRLKEEELMQENGNTSQQNHS